MMKYIILFIAMIFCHVWDDYGRQGILASMKQQAWWKKQEGYTDKYKHDWIPALLFHSISWTTMIMLPVLVFGYFYGLADAWGSFLIVFAINTIIHAVTDSLKCNRFAINLCGDQTIHMLQIIWTFLVVIGEMVR